MFGALTVLALVALAAPGKILQFAPPCLFDLAGFEHCWGCGMTHAVLACLHGQFQQAWDANPRVFLVLPLMAVEYLRFGWRVTGSGRFESFNRLSSASGNTLTDRQVAPLPESRPTRQESD